MSTSQRPNIVQIIWHDLGDWLSCYGKEEIPSPSLQALTEEGVVFDHHFCSAPQCSPSRGSIMTGRYPHSNGLMGLTHRGWEYHPGERDLPDLLNEAGYQTYLFGVQHEHGTKTRLSYKHADTDVRRGHEVANRVYPFFRDAAKDQQPFFVTIGFSDVHRVFGSTYDPALMDRVSVPGYLPDTEVVRKDIATFYENIRMADAAVGRILDALKGSGLEKNTLVFFTTDHGAEFPRAKMTLYDPGIKTTLILRYPGVLQAGCRVEELISNVDMLPTLLDAIGAKIPDTIQGRSFWPLLIGGTYTPREEVYTELTWHAQYDPMRSIRTARYKYIRNFEPGRPILIGGPPAQRYGVDLIEQYYNNPRPEEELYDLSQDPWEKHNLTDASAYQAIKTTLRDRLMPFLQETQDPLLEGPIPHPGRSGYACFWAKEGERFRLNIEEDFHEPPL